MSQVRCPACQKAITLRPELYGRKVKCKCGGVLRMPAAPNQATTTQASQPSEKIKFQCPSCQTQLQVGGELAGRVAKCSCGSKIRVPNQLASAPAPSPLDPFQNSGAPDPFANAGSGMGLMSASSNETSSAPAAVPKYRKKTQKGKGPKVVRHKIEKEERAEVIEFNMEIIGGVVVMLAGIVWLLGGLAAGVLFFGAPILICAGISGIIKGMFS